MNIVTHNGIFHADEIFAIALLRVFAMDKTRISQYPIIMLDEEHYTSFGWSKKPFENSQIEILRTRETEAISSAQKLGDFVIDCGGLYEGKCLDHHQDKMLPASNMMVFAYLLDSKQITMDLYKELYKFMEGISNFDTNAENANVSWSSFNADHKYRNLSNLISGFNRNPSDDALQMSQFNKALNFAIEILQNEIFSATERISAITTYNNREVLANNVAIFSEFCPIWKDQKDHSFAIMPNPQGWSLNSCNSNTNPLPDLSGAKGLIFAHLGRFIAVFKTKEEAILASSTL